MKREAAAWDATIATSAPVNPFRFSAALASLRGIAASIVVFYHALLVFQVGEHAEPHRASVDFADGWLSALQALLVLFNGPNAVILFFVLSGTVLTLSLDRRPLDLSGLNAFYVRRTLRILPLLAVTALVAGGAHLLVFSEDEVRNGTLWMNSYYRHDPGAGEIALNAIGWSNSLNSPAWTIRVEILASILFPLLYMMVGGPWLVFGAVLMLSLIAFAEIGDLKAHIFLIAFYLGALVPTYGARVTPLLPRIGATGTGLIVAALVLMAALVQMVYRPWVHVDPVRVLIISPAAAVLVAMVYFGAGRKLLHKPFLLFLGEISYSMYLLHFGVIFALAHAADPFLPERLQESEALALNIALAAISLAVVIPLSKMAHRTIELPFQELGRQWAAKFTDRVSADGVARR